MDSVIKQALSLDWMRWKPLLIDASLALGALTAGIFVLWGMGRLFPKLYERVLRWKGTVIRSIHFGSHVLITDKGIAGFVILVLRGIRLAVSLGILYALITWIPGLFFNISAWNVKSILSDIFAAVLLTAAAMAVGLRAHAFFSKLRRRLDDGKLPFLKPLHFRTIEVVSVEKIQDFLALPLWALHAGLLLTVVYFYLAAVFSLFDFTADWTATLVDYTWSPIRSVFAAFVAFLPDLFLIIVIALLTRYAIKFAHFFFHQIKRERISFVGFYPEWAEPTYKIVRFLMIVFAAVVIFPYLPGSSSAAFRGISIFLGLLISLGSTSAVSNVVSGVILTYMRPFKIGDRVRIADTIGDVIEKSLLVTRVRTIKNVDITVPNAMVLGSHIVNYSTTAKETGLILHTTVTIGYDVSWRKVHELLVQAALATEGILADPKPFILQTALNNSYVSYELNATTDQPNKMATIYGKLHENIQDTFNKAGVEIMSPEFSALRDGNRVAIPNEHLPPGYETGSFRVKAVTVEEPTVKKGNNLKDGSSDHRAVESN